MGTNVNEMRKKNSRHVFNYCNDGTTARGEQYDPAELDEILTLMENDGITKLISIPVYTERDLVKLDNKSVHVKGVTPIGYVDEISVEKGQISVVIYNTFTDRINNFNNPIIKFRLIVDGRSNYLKQIIAMDILPSTKPEVDAEVEVEA